MSEKASSAADRKKKERAGKSAYGLVRKELWATEEYWPHIKGVVEPLTKFMNIEKTVLELAKIRLDIINGEPESFSMVEDLASLFTLVELGNLQEVGFGEESKKTLNGFREKAIELMNNAGKKPVKEYENLYSKIRQWNNGDSPHLSINEAVVVYFCTGEMPASLKGMLPYQMERALNPWDSSFICDEYEPNFV
jgi:hypothetical protein